jgi:hypothetical protein
VKKIMNLSGCVDHQPEETGKYLDACFYLKKFLRFDGDRYQIVGNRKRAITYGNLRCDRLMEPKISTFAHLMDM